MPSQSASQSSQDLRPDFQEQLISPIEEEILHRDGGVSEQQLQHQEAVLELTLQWIPLEPSDTAVVNAASTPLQKPVVIPRVNSNSFLDACPFPFLRAYSPALRAHDVHPVEFVAFLDNLAIAEAGTPAFQALDMAGMCIGFAAEPWSMAARAAMQVTLGLGTAVVAAIRKQRFLEKANQGYFYPRGLKVSMKEDKDLVRTLAALHGCPDIEKALAPLDSEACQVSLRDRRMAALAPYTAPLELTEVPPPTLQKNILDKISAKELEIKMKRHHKREAKTQRKREEKGQKAQRKQMNGEGAFSRGYIGKQGSDSEVRKRTIWRSLSVK